MIIPASQGTGIPGSEQSLTMEGVQRGQRVESDRTTWEGENSALRDCPARSITTGPSLGCLSLDAHLSHLGIFENWHKDPSRAQQNSYRMTHADKEECAR